MASCGACQDGYIYRDGGAIPCKECLKARNRGEFRGDYHPAGLSARARFRRLQRARARRSVRKRRQLARGRPPRRRERTRELALARAYPKLAQVSREQFARMYEAAAGRHGWKVDRRGLNTAWELYAALWRHYRVYGQDFEVTNGQLSRALERAGRPRRRRTVQLTRKRLEAMGLLTFAWVKRGTWRRDRGWCPGERKDTIRVTALHVRRSVANCTPPTGAEASASMPRLFRSADPKMSAQPPPNDSIAPATPAETDPASAGNDQTTERAELERALAFQEAKIAAGWRSPTIRAELRRCRQALKLLDGEGPAP